MSAAPPAPRVLLVDDNRGFRLELRLLLEDRGIDVAAEGGNGQEAVELAARTDADVVLEDPALKSEATAAYAYLVKGCAGSWS